MGILLTFHQAYQPVLDSILISALVAGLPLYVLFVLLAILRLPAWMCALAAMLTAALLAWIVWGMPFGVTVGTATEGMAFGLWPISWIVLNAVFFHNLTVASGDFDVIKRALTRLTTDRRLQALLIAFSFGALLEGIAGFGAPVAITASILAALGFEPITAAVLALLANTAPVAFGSIGIPVVTLGALVAPILGHKDATSTTLALSAMVGRQLPLFSIIIPAYVNISKLNLLTSYAGAVLVYAALGTPFATFLMTAYFRGLPDELIEAAVVDGLGYGRVFARVALPLAVPAIVTVTVLQFIQIWDDLLVGLLFLQNPQQLHLNRRRHVADLVQKYGSRVRLLELARLGHLRARERALLVAEELAFHQVLREGRAVDLDQRPVLARRMKVNRARDQILAHAAFSRQ